MATNTAPLTRNIESENMTRDNAKQILVFDRAMLGFLVLFASMVASFVTMQLGVKANANEIADVRVDFVAADAARQNTNSTRFRRIEAESDSLSGIITTQAVLLERIVTTTEFIQRDVSKLVDQGGN